MIHTMHHLLEFSSCLYMWPSSDIQGFGGEVIISYDKFNTWITLVDVFNANIDVTSKRG